MIYLKKLWLDFRCKCLNKHHWRYWGWFDLSDCGVLVCDWCGIEKSESSWYKRLDKLLTSICDLIRERG